ncbi:MAG: hypothetical protein RL357_539 [Pseudomonadota bacterium]
MNTSSTPSLRVGQGWDTHLLVPGRPLVLGGITIEHDKGLLGHSDADALLHAVTDAILGAVGMGDIGEMFPDTALEWAGADSAKLLQEVVRQAAATGWRVVNVDTTVVAQAPKLAPFKSAMRERLAQVLNVDVSCVNIKAKTAEGLGPVGAGASIEAQAIVLMQSAGL